MVVGGYRTGISQSGWVGGASGYHTYQNIGLFMRTKHGFEPPFHLLGFNMRRFAENIKKSFMKEVIQI